jgi:aminoglycoside 3-N-acetyltransferase
MDSTPAPVTLHNLAADFRALGLAAGQTLMVHSSLSSIGYVLGGAATVVRALIDVLGPNGTLICPAFTPEISDPATWATRPFGDEWIDRARAHVPTFDIDTTATSMGAIAEAFRRWPGAKRSTHPQVSISARGRLADKIIAPHELAWAQGAGSPLERVYEMDAGLLLLGVGFNRATLLHFAESRIPMRRQKMRRMPMNDGDGRTWIEVPDVADDLNAHFPAIGAAYRAEGRGRAGKIGAADSLLLSARDLVTFASAYLAKVLA